MKITSLWPATPSLLFLQAILSSSVISQYLPSYPLAVRSPYLSTWLTGSSAHDVTSGGINFWNGQDLTWIIMARIDATPYVLFGAPTETGGARRAKQVSITYSASHTLVELTAQNSTFVLDFFSPIDPEDDIRQSLPYSYLSVSAVSSIAHNISIMSAIDGAWVGQQQNRILSNHSLANKTSIFEMEYSNATTFAEEDQMAAWGKTVFATVDRTGSQVTASVASVHDTLANFGKKGALTNSYPAYRSGDLVALAHNFQGVKNVSATFAVGHYREQTINWLDKETHTGFYRSKYPDVTSSVSHFLEDYPAAKSASQRLDLKIQSAATKISKNYSSIVEAAARQVFGAMELTIPLASLNTSDPWTFYKEISSDGNVCSLDSMYHLLPALKVLAPRYINRLLKPYLAYLNTGEWPHPWAIHDIGSHYPNATGHKDGDAEQMPVLASGTLITFVYAWQYVSNDTQLALSNRHLLQKYADYLNEHGLYTTSQLSTVDSIAPSSNQTELAVSSAVALKAFGAMFKNMDKYTQQGEHYADVVYKDGLGLGPGNGPNGAGKKFFSFNLEPSSSTWGLVFSFFPDALLHLKTFPSSAYALQSSWIAGQVKQYGVQYEEKFPDMNVPFAFWVAATGGSELVEAVVRTTWKGLISGLNNVPFPDVIDASNGKYRSAHARGTVGGTFALLAMVDT